MTNFNKTMDYFRKLHRGINHISLVEDENSYWLIEGYTVHKVPKNQMELNPAIFKPFSADLPNIIQRAESGVPLKSTGLMRKENHAGEVIIPFISESEESFTEWFRKALLDTFDPGFSLKSVGPLEPAAVQYAGETVGIILPVRCSDIDIKPFL
jgi:hypothetical protein